MTSANEKILNNELFIMPKSTELRLVGLKKKNNYVANRIFVISPLCPESSGHLP